VDIFLENFFPTKALTLKEHFALMKKIYFLAVFPVIIWWKTRLVMIRPQSYIVLGWTRNSFLKLGEILHLIKIEF
jgi:hypothetical protein